MRHLALIAALLAGPAHADVTGPGGKVIDCYCTDSSGGRVELGEQICLFVDGRAFMARCEMSLNVPMWRDTGAGCVSSALPQSRRPAVDPGGVDAKI
ncbi:hypothetical protein [Actibacterium ureilyticum]|uniref:hypothetical protein n=1 Tax=Actibacterium ureilyticum TaxID=1590614 RepID=UPI000BAB0456|nr:hypothetical protein [Actibacterium ureilyticum]